MDRRVPILAVALTALLTAGGCQDYNFNPVGHCIIQPGTKRVTLSTVSTADVLFVVDDSGSMAGEQGLLGTEFPSFLNVLNTANTQRVANGLAPIDFHLAVTSTANFVNWQPTGGSTCSSSCPGAAGKVCCLGGTMVQPPQCKVDADCSTAAGYTCKAGAGSANIWPTGGPLTGCFDAAGNAQPIACSTVGADCGVDSRFYQVSACNPPYGNANLFTATGEYAMGRFFSDPANASSATPEARGKVLHFDKGFYTPTTNTTALNNLSTAFVKNVVVGTCGSGQEQGLETAKLAVDRVRSGTQSTGYVAGDFLHPNSKLVVVWITDENDCSSPNSPAYGVVFTPNGCQNDESLPAAQQREYAATSYADYFTSLGRPFGAAFITSSKLTGCTDGTVTTDPTCVQCQDTTCYPALCVPASGCGGQPAGTCGGQTEAPYRYDALATELRKRKVDVVSGSVCDAFGSSLGRIAEIVKPPAGLELPTLPAATDVMLLRIAGADGFTRATCKGPAPAGISVSTAIAQGYRWWFTATKDQVTDPQKTPSGISKFVYIVNSVNTPSVPSPCDANPGETYSVDYIGRLPAENPLDPINSPGGCLSEADCAAALGGKIADWTCFAGTTGAAPNELCVAPTTTARGTCVCGGRTTNCPNNP